MGIDWNSFSCLAGNNGDIATVGCLLPLFKNIVAAALIFAGAVALIFIIVAGLRLILSGGDAKKIDQGRKTLTFSVIGLLVILLSFAIINVISKVTGVTCINNFGFNQCSGEDTTSSNYCPSDVNFNDGGIPAYSCACQAGATEQFGECDTDGKKSCPYNTPFGELDQTTYPPGSCSCPSDSHQVGSGPTGQCKK